MTAAQHARDDLGRGDRLALDEVEQAGGVEGRHERLVAGVPRRGQHGERAREVEHRRDEQEARVGVEGPNRLDVHRVGHERAVAEHDALGRARRTAGVEEPGEVVLGDVVGEGGRVRAGEQRLVAVAGVDDVLDARGQVGDLAVGEQDPRARVLQRVAQLRVGVAVVERHEHRARARDRLVQLEVAVRVPGDDGDAVPATGPERVQPADEATAALPQLGVRQLEALERDRGRVRGDRDRAPQRPEHRRGLGHGPDATARRPRGGRHPSPSGPRHHRLPAGPVRRAQLALEDLARARLRQRLRPHARSSWAPCSPRSPPRQYATSSAPVTGGARHDDGVDGLAPALVRDAEDRRLEHGGVAVEDVLDLGAVHVLAARDDHVLRAVDEVDVGLVVHVAEVAGAVPAVDERVGGLLGLVPVPRPSRSGRGRRPRPPRRPGRSRRRRARSRRRRRPPAGRTSAPAARRAALLDAEQRRRDRRGLGRAVEVQQLGAGKRLVGAAQRLGRDRRAAEAHDLERGDVARARVLLLVHRREHARHDERRGHPLARDQVEHRAGIERGHRHVAAGVPDRREHGDRPGRVEQRRDDEPARGGGERPRRSA